MEILPCQFSLISASKQTDWTGRWLSALEIICVTHTLKCTLGNK